MTWWISVLAKVIVVALVAVAAVPVTITGARTVGAVTSHSAGAMTEVAGAAI